MPRSASILALGRAPADSSSQGDGEELASPARLSSSLCVEVGGALALLAAALPPRRETREVGAARLRGGCPT